MPMNMLRLATSRPSCLTAPLPSYSRRHWNPSFNFSTSAALNKVAIVTGASRGIGRAIAFRLANDGFDLSLNDLSSSKESLGKLESEISSLGRKCFISCGDMSEEGDVKRLVDGTVGTLGSVDVMVANAGICLSKSFIETSTKDLNKLYDINIRGVFLCYKYAALQMIKQGQGGRIIGASSVAGKQGYVGIGAYCMSKFAVRGMTQSAASELGKYGITVNAYAPGAIDTVMLRELGDVKEGGREEFYEQQKNLAAVNRVGNVDDVADLVSYLASNKSGFITGQSISVNGGTYFD